MSGLLRVACWTGVAFFLAAGAQPAWASPDYTKKERKKCVYCHDGGWGSGKLTAAGKYFLAHNRSLKGFVEAPVASHAQAPTSGAGR